MKLYYDVLLPFMPEQHIDTETNQAVIDPKLQKLRGVLANLSDYQMSGNPWCLSYAIIQLCEVYELNVIETITKVVEDTYDPFSTEMGTNDMVLNNIAKSIFLLSVNDLDKFNVFHSIADLLYLMHMQYDRIRLLQSVAAAEQSDSEEIAEVES